MFFIPISFVCVIMYGVYLSIQGTDLHTAATDITPVWIVLAGFALDTINRLI